MRVAVHRRVCVGMDTWVCEYVGVWCAFVRSIVSALPGMPGSTMNMGGVTMRGSFNSAMHPSSEWSIAAMSSTSFSGATFKIMLRRRRRFALTRATLVAWASQNARPNSPSRKIVWMEWATAHMPMLPLVQKSRNSS